ncbi:DUF3189 family protein [Alkaliphilus pronyensis]|uniref:DUF3189 family protein n=1 Tax=Alkaliphilus pronyensis TaxID=1482732 RepID=A0A6I0FHC3_9FIRM|nr:DUF3189 family protein [Alkaliphilus pronyensis]KAB3537798.1 DUF3189 family protein [Alkaliphilus pronyensis]
MYVIYHGTGRIIIGSILSKIHLNSFDINILDSIKTKDALCSLHKIERQAIGRLVFLGRDQHENEVFLLNTIAAETIIIPALLSVFDIHGIDKKEILLVDTGSMSDIFYYLGSLFMGISLLNSYGVNLIKFAINRHRGKILNILDTTKAKTEK